MILQQEMLPDRECYKVQVLYNGGEPKRFSYAEIMRGAKVGKFFRHRKELW